MSSPRSSDQASAVKVAPGPLALAAGKPPIMATPLNAFFWEGARRKELLIQRCDACGRYTHPPLPACPVCGGGVTPTAMSGRGTVESFTIVRRVFHPAFAEETPYVVARIELAEQSGLVLVTNVRGAPVESVHVGMAVQATYEDAPGGVLPQFRPVGGAP